MNPAQTVSRYDSPPSYGRTTLVTLAGRELRRFIINPIFLASATIVAWATWSGPNGTVTEIDTVSYYPAAFLGGFGLMATFSLTRSMRASEPVIGVTPTTLPMRTAALCTVAILPLLCGVLTLFAFLHLFPLNPRLYGAFSPPTQVAVLVGQIVLPSLGGPLLGVALGRWVAFRGAGFVLFLVIFGWVNLVTFPSLSDPGSTSLTALRLFSPFAFFTYSHNGNDLTTWRGSPWFFIGWQLTLCATAVLVALRRGADGRTRTRVTRSLQLVILLAAVMLGLAVTGGFTHPVHT
jgi:hypothetical protein